MRRRNYIKRFFLPSKWWVIIVFAFACVEAKAQSEDTIPSIQRSHWRGIVSYEAFTGGFSNWLTGTIQYKRVIGSYSVIPRMTVSNRFDQTGVFGELDLYKQFDNNDYINISGGLSDKGIFPRATASAEYFNPFGKWEHSIGCKVSYYDNSGTLITGVASLSRYYYNLLSILRVYVAMGGASSLVNNLSFYNQNRYYLSNESYLSLDFKYGFDNDLVTTLDNSGLGTTTSNPFIYGVGLGFNSQPKNSRNWRIILGWARYELITTSRDQYSVTFMASFYQ